MIKANVRPIREILDKNKYSIDVFQREYKWETRQIEQLLNDLESKFCSSYTDGDERKKVGEYQPYHMGSIITSISDSKHYIIDGQQRLTSITLLLIHLKHLQQNLKEADRVDVDTMILSTQYGQRSYNLDIEDRTECMDALYECKEPSPSIDNESAKNIIKAYDDIVHKFPDILEDKLLTRFTDWLINKVMLVEIQTSANNDAYDIFETMNDRGLSLTSAEMLKGYIMSQITSDKKSELNNMWKETITRFKKISKNEDSEFFKAWLRGCYAKSIRMGKKDAENEDFEKIGTRFHNWVRENTPKLKLHNPDDFSDFIKNNFVRYSNLYFKVNNATDNLIQNLEYVYYIEKLKIPPSFYYPMIMSVVSATDSDEIVDKKINLVCRFLEMYYIFRKINSKTTSHSSVRYQLYHIVTEIRNKTLPELASYFKTKAESFDSLSAIKKYQLKRNSKTHIHYLLARMTSHIEQKSNIPNTFDHYVNKRLEDPFTIEHLWADKFDDHHDDFDDEPKFQEWRNNIAALVLIPKSFNSSYGDCSYTEKLPHYDSQNLLVRSLNSQCYEKNPSFLNYIQESNLPFMKHPEFRKSDVVKRQNLYQKICEDMWSTDGFEEMI